MRLGPRCRRDRRLDDGSLDETAAVAPRRRGPGRAEATILPEAGPGSGKGNALWKSLYECRGDIICWIDADLRNFRGEYVDRLVRAAAHPARHVFVKAYYTARTRARLRVADA